MKQERTNMHISRLYFPVILDDFIPPPSFRSYFIDISNYSPREPTRAREPHSQSKRHAPQIRATWNTSTSLAALLYVETRENNLRASDRRGDGDDGTETR